MPNTIEQNVERLKAVVPAIKNSIITKGGTVNSGDGLEEFADDVLSIKNELTDISITSNGEYYSGEETTLTTTTFPVTVLDAVGTPLKHVDVIGNANQSDTPSPDNPIMPQGTGDMTRNLADLYGVNKSALSLTFRTVDNMKIVIDGKKGSGNNVVSIKTPNISVPAGKYTVKIKMVDGHIENMPESGYGVFFGINQNTYAQRTSPGVLNIGDVGTRTFTLSEDTIISSFDISPGYAVNANGPIFNNATFECWFYAGTGDEPYEPYGIKIPISNGGENLWDEDYTGINTNAIYRPLFVGDGVFTLSTNFKMNGNITDIFLLSGNVSSGISSSTNGAYKGKNITVQSVNGYITIAYRANARPSSGSLPYCKTMLNRGSKALPYEPYRHATTTAYLGEVETVRYVKKLVLDGTEDFQSISSGNNKYFRLSVEDFGEIHIDTTYCTHFESVSITSSTTNVGIGVIHSSVLNKDALGIRPPQVSTTSLEDFTTYLTQQYNNGTPVTVWYVLATPTTGIVNEPLMKIGEYADQLSIDTNIPLEQNAKNIINIDTTLKPSSASFTYNKKGTYIGYNKINVNVSNTYTVEDEGKVVNNAALVSQTAMPTEITVNDTYDTTLYNSITVNVPPPTSTKTDTTGSGIKFIGDGNPLIRCDIEGNMDQQGTPSPSSIIMPDETGDKTANLCDESIIQNGYYGSTGSLSVFTSDDNYRAFKMAIKAGTYTIKIQADEGIRLLRIATANEFYNVQEDNTAYTFVISEDSTVYVSWRNLSTTNSFTNMKVMLNEDDTPLPYQPSGYYLPTECGGTTTPVYLGEVESTRKIEKLVLTGDEEWSRVSLSDGSAFYTNIVLPAISTQSIAVVCTHYRASTTNENYVIRIPNVANRLLIFHKEIATTADFKTYLQQQYAAGTPVTVWYVLAEPTTGIVNEPIRKIGDYADSVSPTGIPTIAGLNEFRVATTLPPSKTTIEYRYIENIPTLDSKTITANGIYDASDDNLDGYSSVNVDVAGGGGGGSNAGVVFYDYDGTVVNSYSAADFANLSELPANPTHEGLTAQGWNWSLADAKAYVANYGSLNIGQMYTTSDGKTRLYISLSDGRTSPILQLYLNDNSELDIDWGDGSTHSTFTATSSEYKSERHEYSVAGDYVIAITVVSGGFELQSSSTDVSSILWNGNNQLNSPDRVYDNAIKKIEIGNGVTSIGVKAFYNCSSLSLMTIPDNVTSIGDNAFDSCSSLSSITIPDSVTSIGSAAFNNCYSLSSVAIPDSVATISDSAFYNCYSLLSMTLPNDLTSISDNTFYNCSSLSSIIIPNGVTTIGDDAFDSCYSLSSITIPDTVTSIGSSTFYNCSSLSSITIPDGVTSIGGSAFSTCYSLSSITLPDTVTSIGIATFVNCKSLTSITIPDGVTSIGNNVFSGCSSLSSITIPDSVTSIGNNTFSSCTSLSSITIPNTVTSIGSSAFFNCTSLSSVTIPNSVTTIGNSIFSGCSSLSSVTISNKITSIGMNAFTNCSSLSSITIPDGVTTIGSGVFSGCSSLSSITIPDSVTSIGAGAFTNCSSLSSITIPDNVTAINGTIFSGCSSLSSITISDKVTSIGANAFSNCAYMSYIKFESTTPPTVSNANAWNGLSTSTKILVPSGTLATYKSASKYPNPSTYTYEEY